MMQYASSTSASDAERMRTMSKLSTTSPAPGVWLYMSLLLRMSGPCSTGGAVQSTVAATACGVIGRCAQRQLHDVCNPWYVPLVGTPDPVDEALASFFARVTPRAAEYAAGSVARIRESVPEGAVPEDDWFWD